jgi:hypothetical protein
LLPLLGSHAAAWFNEHAHFRPSLPELRVAAAEQAKITRIRLEKLLAEAREGVKP